MANMRLPDATRSALVNALRNLIDAGSAGGSIKFYTGTQPATGGGGLAGNTLIGTLTLSDPSAPDAAAGVLTFSAIGDDTDADAAGAITWARAADSNAVTAFDCDVSATGGGGTIQLSSTTAAVGDILRVTAFTVTMPAS